MAKRPTKPETLPEVVYDVALEQYRCPEPGEPDRCIFNLDSTFIKRVGEDEIPFMDPTHYGFRRQKPAGIRRVQVILGRNLLLAKSKGVPMKWLTHGLAALTNKSINFNDLTTDQFLVLEHFMNRAMVELGKLGPESAREHGIKIPLTDALR